MSLARFALRLSAVHALRGATLVGDNVRDSDITAIDVSSNGDVRTDEDRPFIVIYTDDGNEDEAPLRDLRQNGLIDFVCEFGIATAMTTINEETGENTIGNGFAIPATDAAFEMTLDLVGRQIATVLGGEDSPWAEIWRGLHDNVVRIETRRASSAEDGSRVAARQLRIRLKAKADPVWGQPIGDSSIWRRFIAALQEDEPDLAQIAAAFLGPQGSAVTAETIRRSRGHTAPELAALGYGPQHPGGDDFIIQTPVVENDG